MQSTNEIWKPVTAFPAYEVSNLGRVKSMKGKKEKILKVNLIGRDYKKEGGAYESVMLYRDGKGYPKGVHTLVATEFVQGYAEGLQIDHIDRDKRNNSADNLQWVTPLQNQQRKYPDALGVTYIKQNKKWKAQIKLDGKCKYLGQYTDKYDAIAAYQRARKERNKWEELKNVV